MMVAGLCDGSSGGKCLRPRARAEMADADGQHNVAGSRNFTVLNLQPIAVRLFLNPRDLLLFQLRNHALLEGLSIGGKRVEPNGHSGVIVKMPLVSQNRFRVNADVGSEYERQTVGLEQHAVHPRTTSPSIGRRCGSTPDPHR
jgi:hypothetical protein